MNIFSQGKISVMKLASVKMENITRMKKLLFFYISCYQISPCQFLKNKVNFSHFLNLCNIFTYVLLFESGIFVPIF